MCKFLRNCLQKKFRSKNFCANIFANIRANFWKKNICANICRKICKKICANFLRILPPNGSSFLPLLLAWTWNLWFLKFFLELKYMPQSLHLWTSWTFPCHFKFFVKLNCLSQTSQTLSTCCCMTSSACVSSKGENLASLCYTWGDLLRSLPHIKTEVKLNFQANSESNSK